MTENVLRLISLSHVLVEHAQDKVFTCGVHEKKKKNVVGFS